MISGCSPAFCRIAILKNLKSHKNVMEIFFKIKTFKSRKKVMECFFNGRNFKSPKKVMESFSVSKALKQQWCSFSVLNYMSRKAVLEFFLSFKSFKSRKKVTESFFSGHASLSYYMIHIFPGRNIWLHWNNIWITFLWL